MLRRKKSGRECNFPINCYYRTNKLQSGTFVPAAPLPPLSHASCESPNLSLWAVREVPVHVSPRAGPLSQGNRCSQWISQISSELTRAWLSANCLSLSFFLFISLPSWEDFWMINHPSQNQSAWQMKVRNSAKWKNWRPVIKIQCSDMPFQNFLLRLISLTLR